MQKPKRLSVKHQKAKRRIQFAMYTGLTLDQNHAVQTIIPEVERYRFERFFDNDDTERTIDEFS